MRQRLPIVLSVTALVVAVLGWTSVGGAVRKSVSSAATGTRGETEAFVTTGTEGAAIGSTSTTLASLELPGGSYLLIGRATVSGSGPPQVVRCTFTPSGTGRDAGALKHQIQVGQMQVVKTEQMVVTDTVSLRPPAGSSPVVKFSCRRFGNPPIDAFRTVVIALKLDKLTAR